MRLAGPQAPGQFAQAFGQDTFGETAFDVAQAVSEPIAQVETSTGSVTAVRVDGTRVTLGEGDTLFQGDVIETGAGAALGIVFVDDTTFAMGAEGRAVMDEFVFNADTGDGSFNMSLVQGALRLSRARSQSPVLMRCRSARRWQRSVSGAHIL